MSYRFETVYLHFGGDKTGSSTIQAFLDKYRDDLMEDHRVAYGPGASHPQLGSYFSKTPETYIYNVVRGENNCEKIRQLDESYFSNFTNWVESISGCKRLVLSYEGYVDLTVDALEDFRAYCSQIAESVKIILYVRPPLSYASSAMSQRAKQGRRAWDENELPISGYGDFLEKIEPVFGSKNIIVRAYSRDALSHENILSDFLSVIGVAESFLSHNEDIDIYKNKSVSNFALVVSEAIVRELNFRGFVLSDAAFYVYFAEWLESIPGREITLTDEQLETILDATNFHSEYLRKNYNIIFNENISAFAGRSDAEFVISRDAVRRAVDCCDRVASSNLTRPEDLSAAVVQAMREVGLFEDGIFPKTEAANGPGTAGWLEQIAAGNPREFAISNFDLAHVKRPAGIEYAVIELAPGKIVCEIEGGIGLPRSQSITDGFSVRIADNFKAAASGRRIRITVCARSKDKLPLDFAVAYSNQEVGDSGWQTFSAGAAFEDYVFIYDVPARIEGKGDFIGILPDIEGQDRTLVVYFVRADVIS